MNNPYDLHSWSRQCREEALSEARMRHIAKRAGREPRRLRRIGLRRIGLAWRSVLTPLVRRMRLAG